MLFEHRGHFDSDELPEPKSPKLFLLKLIQGESNKKPWMKFLNISFKRLHFYSYGCLYFLWNEMQEEKDIERKK